MRRLVVVLLLVAALFVIAYAVLPRSPSIPESAVLVVELGGNLEETPPTDPLSRLLARGWALPTLLLQLEKAAHDERVKGILVHIRPLSIGYARVQELRQALAQVRSEGTKVAALIDVASLNATREVYLASAADQVYLVPGFVGPFAGIAGEYLFLGELMEKIGIDVEYERAGEYKSAVETFAEREMSPETRAMLDQLLDTLYQQIVVGIGLERGLGADEVTALVDQAPATPAAYLPARLVDGVATREEIVERLGGSDAEEVALETYFEVDPRELGLRTGPSLALVFGEGTIVQSQDPRLFGGNFFAADRIAQALRSAGDDPSIEAIVLRINSGGGSALASDSMWRAVREVGEKKPIVVSLADVAASGGYYVASAAAAVVAEPATVTGSIGVFLLRPSLEPLYAKLGIHTELLTRGRLAGLPSSTRPLTEAQREVTRSLVANLYALFLERVAEGREMPSDEVDRVGRGRVWLGETAHTLGLVDEIGGLDTAVERAKREAGIAEEVDPARIVYPGPRSLAQQVRDLLRGAAWRSPLDGLERLGIPEPLCGWLHLPPGQPALLPTSWLELR